MFLKILAPFAPHITEEIWRELGHDASIHLEKWPEYDAELAKDSSYVVAVQINGKVRARIEIGDENSENEVKEKVLANKQVQKWIDGKEIKKVVYIKNKIFSIVI